MDTRELRRVAGSIAGILVLGLLAPAVAQADWVSEYLVLNGCDFVGAGDSMSYNQNGCVVDPLAPDSYIYWAAVHLPDGARILADGHSATICKKPGTLDPPIGSEITVEIFARDLDSPNAGDPAFSRLEIFSPTCSLQADPPMFSTFHYVDNEHNSYAVKVNNLKPGFELNAVRIDYQVEEPWDCLVCVP